MVVDARRPPTNFINRNIQTFVPTRTTSAPPSTISINGVSVIFCKKEKIKKRKKINFEKIEHYTEIKPPPVIEKPKQRKKHLAKIEKSYSGVRRTSIRSKEVVVRPLKQPEARVDKIPPKREILNLPVTQIPAPEPHPTNFGLFLSLAKKSWKKYDWPGNRTCEALEKHPTTLERLLAAMDASLRQTQSGENSLTLNEPIKTDIDNSYEHVYQRHVDTLNSVISSTASSETDGKRKRKAPPKLEIKIAPSDQYVDVVTQDIEDLNLSDKVDNCGDLTPVITYNHVSTVSPLAELQYSSSISPGTSSKGSRSPSPLLEVPNLTGEIAAKFPTA